MKEVHSAIADQQIERINVKDLVEFQGNLKDLSVANYEKLKNSILKLGFSFVIHVWRDKDKTYILDGHQRTRTMQKMIEEGYSVPHVPIVHVTAKDYKEAKQKVLAGTSQFGEMTGEGLYQFIAEAGLDWRNVVEENRFAEIDFKEFADEYFIDQHGSGFGSGDQDNVPTPTGPIKSKTGDVFILGEHILTCGDSTDLATVNKLIGATRIDLVYTDPPYGINEETDRDFASRTRLAKGNTFAKIIGDTSIETALKGWAIAQEISKVICYWGGNYYAHKLPPSPCWIVWDKRVEENQRDMNSDCEMAYVKHPTKESIRIFRHLWKGMIKGSEQGEGRVHPTQKPVALADWCFRELNADGKTVLDLFAGSGSALIAAERAKRKCFAIEIDPLYCDVIINRWEKLTGKKASRLKPDGELVDWDS